MKRRRTCRTTPRHVPRARDRETELAHHLENVTKKRFQPVPDDGGRIARCYLFTGY